MADFINLLRKALYVAHINPKVIVDRTTPEFIEKIYEFTKDYQKPARRELNLRVLSSERKALKIDLDGKFLIVGERINPTGKKALQAEL